MDNIFVYLVPLFRSFFLWSRGSMLSCVFSAQRTCSRFRSSLLQTTSRRIHLLSWCWCCESPLMPPTLGLLLHHTERHVQLKGPSVQR